MKSPIFPDGWIYDMTVDDMRERRARVQNRLLEAGTAIVAIVIGLMAVGQL